MKIFLNLAFLTFAILMAGCNKSNPEWAWYQEAMQDDGSIILVKQIETSLNEARNVPGQQLMGYHRPKLEFADPKTGLPVTWYPQNLPRIFPYALHVHDKVPYLFATFYLTDDYHEFGCPVPPYIVFQWDGGKWVRINFSQLPQKFKLHNLLISGERPLVTTQNNDHIKPNQIVDAERIFREIRSIGGPIGTGSPRRRYEQEIQHQNIGLYGECNGHENSPSQYDFLEIK